MPPSGGRRRALRHGLAAPVVAFRRAVRDRRVVRVQLAWAAVMIGSWAATVSLSVAAYSAGGSRAVAVAVLARTVPGAFAGPAIGVLVDRAPHRLCLLGAAAVGALACGAAALASPLPAVVAAITVTALATMVFRTAQSAVVPDLVTDPADLTAANVLSSSVEAVGVFAGPALAGLLLALAGPDLAFGTAAGLFGLACVVLVGLRTGRGTAPAGPVEGGGGSFRELFRLAPARLLLLLVMAQTVVAGALAVLYPALAVQTLDADVSVAGLLAAAFGLGGAVGSLLLFGLAGSRRLGLISSCSLLLWSVPLLVLPLFPSLGMVLGLLAVVGLGNVLFDVTSVTLFQRAVPGRLLGRVFGAVETAVVLGLGLGAGAATVLVGLVSPEASVALVAAPLVAVALAALPALRRLDRDLVAPTREVELLRGLDAFALLPTPAIELLALQMTRQEVATGEVVIRQGEPGHAWYVIDLGDLDVAVDGRHVRTLGGGDSFGEVALLRTGARTATVTAASDAVIWSADRDALLAVVRADDGRALAALDRLAGERLRHAAPGST